MRTCHRGLSRTLPNLFPNSAHVNSAGLSGTPDEAIWQYAKTQGFTFLTKGKDFVNLSIVWGAPPKVIVPQTGNCSAGDVIRIVRNNAIRLSEFDSDATRSLLILR